MWRTISNSAIVIAFIVMIGMEVLRPIVHKHRERKYGLGGTQDIAMYGAFLAWAVLIIGAIAGVVSFFND